MAARARSLWFGTREGVVVLAFGAAAALVVVPARATNDSRSDEANAIEVVRRVAAAEGSLREARSASGAPGAIGDYGTLSDLAHARLIEEKVVSDSTDPHLEVGGYRFEVLRPERVERGGRLRWTRGDGRVDPSVASSMFAVTAIPRRGAERGLRSFYLDAKGRFYASEGVQDADRDPSRTPPAFELRDNREETGEGPIWRLEHPTSSTRRTGR